jgi:hypothetical protein
MMGILGNNPQKLSAPGIPGRLRPPDRLNRRGVIATRCGSVDQGFVALWVMAHQFCRPLSYVGYSGLGKQVRDVLHVADLCRPVEEQVRDIQSWDDGSATLLEVSITRTRFMS